MRGVWSVGQILIAVAAITLGVAAIVTDRFGLIWQPVPKDLYPYKEILAYFAGGLIVAFGVGLLIPRTAAIAALLLSALVFAQVVLLRLPMLIANPAPELNWYAVGETTCWAAGVFALYVTLSGKSGLLADIARWAFGLALVPIGLSHFFYLDVTVRLIPNVFPEKPAFAMATGAAHMLAGVAVALGVVPRLAATLEGVMMALFTVIVWIPGLIGAPQELGEWSEICVSTSLTGAAFAIAQLVATRKSV